MRIFHILEFNQFNTGSVHQMFQAASGLRERGHDVTVVSRPDDTLERRCQESRVAFVGLPMRNQFDLNSARKLRRLIRERDPHVIHVHKGVAHALALAAVWSRPGPAFVVNRGVSFPLDIWNRGKFRTRRVDRVVTVCEQIRRIVIRSAMLPPERVVVIYAGTDIDLFDPERWDARAFRTEKNIDFNKFLIAQVGVRDWKGWKELIDATAEVAGGHPDAHLALIGCRDPGEISAVNDYANMCGIRDGVTAVEYRTDMPNVFASCDLVVDASWAGTGITGTIREAMAMQKPVIATDCGGNGELVSSQDVGWLVPPRSVKALAAAIRDVIDHRERAAAVARNARRRVVRGFSKELRISRLENLYSSILDLRF
ncbi:MAG TPA: glycosyltransferase family 4 protein [Thermoanaerobaculia bacterium]|nr:glycosyltransferase family 4 protein [Thermoanaerobaculia bacterium]